jgi:phosphoribosylformylglycinamidine synthase
MTPRFGVFTFPGSLNDKDAARAVRLTGGESNAISNEHASHYSVDTVN